MLWVYFLIVNFWLFCLMGLDKQKAKKEQWRIKESTLWILAWIGGALGGWIGMRVFRHKTQHRSFAYGLPALFVLQLSVLVCFYMIDS